MFNFLLAIALMIVPYIFWKKFDLTYILYLIFIFCTIILGDEFDFYYKISHWDSIMHFFSGFITSLLALSIIDNKLKGIYKIIFCISFSLAIGSVWEICEFAFDNLLNRNAMRTLGKCGLDAVSDSIKDLVLDLSGSLFILFNKKTYK